MKCHQGWHVLKEQQVPVNQLRASIVSCHRSWHTHKCQRLGEVRPKHHKTDPPDNSARDATSQQERWWLTNSAKDGAKPRTNADKQYSTVFHSILSYTSTIPFLRTKCSQATLTNTKGLERADQNITTPTHMKRQPVQPLTDRVV